MNEPASTHQSFERWFPVAGVPAYFGDYSLHDDFDGFRVILHPAKGSDRDLVLTFGRAVLGYRLFGEFAHPRLHQETSPEPSPETSPEPSPEWPWGTYPLLIVRDSEWLATFSDSQLAPWFEQAQHYFFYTLSNSFDILAHAQPEAHWQPTQLPIDRNGQPCAGANHSA